MYKSTLISCDSPCWLQRCWQMIQRTDQVLLWVGQLQNRYFLLWLLVRAPWRKPMIEMYIYSHCLHVAITTPEGGSWSDPHIKISHPAQERLAMPPGCTFPILFKRWGGFFYVLQEPEWDEWKLCETGLANGFSSLSEKTRKSNHLQMSSQKKHFLLSYLKTLSVAGPAVSWTRDLPLSRPALSQLSSPTRTRKDDMFW